MYYRQAVPLRTPDYRVHRVSGDTGYPASRRHFFVVFYWLLTSSRSRRREPDFAEKNITDVGIQTPRSFAVTGRWCVQNLRYVSAFFIYFFLVIAHDRCFPMIAQTTGEKLMRCVEALVSSCLRTQDARGQNFVLLIHILASG